MITITQLNRWLTKNRYKNYNLAQTLRITPAAISQWRVRGCVPDKYQKKLNLIMQGEKKLTLKPLKR